MQRLVQALELTHQEGAGGVDRLDLATDDRATVVERGVVGERIGVELLDAQRDALALDIDGQWIADDDTDWDEQSWASNLGGNNEAIWVPYAAVSLGTGRSPAVQ